MARSEGRERDEDESPGARSESVESKRQIDDAAWESFRPEILTGLGREPREVEARNPSDADSTESDVPSPSEPVDLWKRGDDEGEIDVRAADRVRSETGRDATASTSTEGATEPEAPDDRISDARRAVEDAYAHAPKQEAPDVTSTIDADSRPEATGDDDGPSGRHADAGLSATDLAALRKYTGDGSEDLNRALWDGSIADIQSEAAFSRELSAALEKLPEHQGTALRGSEPGRHASEYQLDRYEPGARVVENGYLSCTVNPEREFDGEVLWVIESKSGRNVEAFSSVRDEQEVLMDRFSTFTVLSKEFEEDLGKHGRWLIYMEEE